MKPKYKSPEFRWALTIYLHLYAYLRTVWWCCTEAGWTVWPSWLLTGNKVRDKVTKIFQVWNFALRRFLFFKCQETGFNDSCRSHQLRYFHISTEDRKRPGSCRSTAPLLSVWGPQSMKLRLQVPKDQFPCCSSHETAKLRLSWEHRRRLQCRQEKVIRHA